MSFAEDCRQVSWWKERARRATTLDESRVWNYEHSTFFRKISFQTRSRLVTIKKTKSEAIFPKESTRRISKTCFAIRCRHLFQEANIRCKSSLRSASWYWFQVWSRESISLQWQLEIGGITKTRIAIRTSKICIQIAWQERWWNVI